MGNKWSSVSCKGPTVQLVKRVRLAGNDQLILEALAQYDPSEVVLSEDLSYKEKVERVMELHEINPRFVDLDERTDSDEQKETVATS